MTAEQKIRDAYERSGITQQDLSDRSGVALSTVNRFANGGEPRLRVLRALAAAFGFEIAARKPRAKR